jgi:hypothetical protein
MAAHILRMLNEFATRPELTADQILSALNYTSAPDSLDYNDYCDLHDAIAYHPRHFFVNVVNQIMPKYVEMFFKLDCPRTDDEWKERIIAKRGY